MARRLFILNDAPYGTERATTASAGEVTLIDVRPREEYVAAHIPGAISVPLAGLGKCLGDLKERRDIVASCRGSYCVMALDAVDLLRRRASARTALNVACRNGGAGMARRNG